ncbi:MAG TPA: UvrD-helicase domain-containing protein, partial [bacterium]|nr:UvrD-helicase domain-containing protein [bacterium]
MSRIYISSDKPLRPKIIPVMDVYDIPHLTDEESARYSELKKIVKNIKAHNNSQICEKTGSVENFYRTQLNPMQCEAVFQLVGAILVIAGAGSGKTRTIVHRVAYMLQKGIDPQSILLLTFTRRASGE